MSRGMRPIFTTPDGRVVMINTLMSDRIASCLNGNQESRFGSITALMHIILLQDGWREGLLILNTRLKLFSKKQRE